LWLCWLRVCALPQDDSVLLEERAEFLNTLSE
jgi:hypothetical protein